jgi:hypothetical protein
MSAPGRLIAVQITKYTPIFSRDVTYLRFLACKIDLNAETHRALLQPVCLFICASYGLPKFKVPGNSLLLTLFLGEAND